jgi:hypothetical protein
MLRRHPLSGKNFQAESNIGVFKDDLRWDIRTGWIHEGMSEIKTTVLGVNQHQAGYWIDLVNTKALLEQNGYGKALTNPQRCGSKVDTIYGVHLGGSE